jgi:hypothetical protein
VYLELDRSPYGETLAETQSVTTSMLFNTRGGSRDIFRGGDQGGDGRVRGPRSLREGRDGGGRK